MTLTVFNWMVLIVVAATLTKNLVDLRGDYWSYRLEATMARIPSRHLAAKAREARRELLVSASLVLARGVFLAVWIRHMFG